MKRHLLNPVYWLAGIAILASLIVIAGCKERPVQRLSSVVKVLAGNGHGSGVSIGDGIILTARHVVGDLKAVKLKGADGNVQDAEVLWTSDKYDIAYVRASKPDLLGNSHLSCREPAFGEVVSIVGNPVNMEFVTVWGRIAGSSREVGPWASAVPTDITVAPGQSGGAMFDEDGNVVAIVTGVMVAPLGFAGSLVPIGYAVPGKAICGLMARGA